MPETTVYVGTSGWSYPSGYGVWRGTFYPRGFNGDELAYYAERFPSVEVNSSFYRVPTRHITAGWIARTPRAFRFTAKLFRKFTHPSFYAREEGASPEIMPEDVASVREMLDAFAEDDRLGALLVQYPDFHVYDEASLADLARTLGYFEAYPLVVEIRHCSWLQPRAFEVLHHFHAGLARIDEPFFNNLEVPLPDTGGVPYFRFHGRNGAEWRKPGAGAHRYDYLYTPGEVSSLTEAVLRVTGDRPTFAFFNNHPNSKAIANAVQLAARLGLALPFHKLSYLSRHFPDLREILGSDGEQMELL